MTSPPDTAAPQPLRIAVVNDYELIVRGVAAMLQDEPSVCVVELDCDLPVSQPVDVALYDAFAMAGLHDEDIDAIVSSDHVGGLVLYTWDAPADVVADARRRGLAGVISKAEPVDALVAGLRRATTGEFVVSSSFDVPEGGAIGRERDWPGRAYGLTAREAEVVGLVTQGFSNQEIADRMYVSINSIKSYIRSAYRTMGVATRAQAVLWGVDHGLAPQRLRVVVEDRI